jgi:signal transduction histidine kinase
MVRLFIGWVTILLFFGAKLMAQQKADSLLKIAQKSTNDSVKIKCMNDAVWDLMFTEKVNSLKIALDALKIAEATKNNYSLSDCYNTLGVYYYITSDFTTSLDFHEKALAIRTRLNDIKGLMSTYNNLASVLKELGNYKDEVNYYFDALKIAEANKDSIPISRILNNIADAFLRQEQYTESEKYNLMALDIRQRLGDIPGIISCYINLGNVKHSAKEYKSSEDYFLKAAGLLQKEKDNYLLAKYYANYGSLLKDMDRPDEALKFIELSIETNDLIGNANSNLMNYVNLGNIYHLIRQIKKAHEAYAKALDLSQKMGNKQWERQALLGLSNTSAEMNDYEKAFDYRLKYDEIKDTLKTKEMNQLFAEMGAKYELDKKDTEIKLLAVKNKNAGLQVRQRNFAVIGITVLFILLATLTFFIISRNKIKEQLKTEELVKHAEEKERVRIAKDIHDEIGSGLTKIRFMSEVFASSMKDNQAINSISETSKNLIENMRDLIWVMNPDNTKLDTLVARIREYSHDYLEEFPVQLKMHFPADINSLSISKEAHRNIFMIVKECLQNCIKHSGATEITIKAAVGKDLLIEIEDNGIGLKEENDHEGNGLKNMRNRIQSIQGSLTIRSAPGNGTKIKIEVPLENILKA